MRSFRRFMDLKYKFVGKKKVAGMATTYEVVSIITWLYANLTLLTWWRVLLHAGQRVGGVSRIDGGNHPLHTEPSESQSKCIGRYSSKLRDAANLEKGQRCIRHRTSIIRRQDNAHGWSGVRKTVAARLGALFAACSFEGVICPHVHAEAKQRAPRAVVPRISLGFETMWMTRREADKKMARN
ncbi:hypothetical protein EJ04DRAFT_268830 [Polyplosphaeria fusca]|uniref:Uncharacterized protein n=1 Tax=Polyplosphaeria fusca TaxID=682080 RepID=A0A9P4QZ63_9PLEO|nr:hypothetical protein EJ04DRAFT_268830 [Polyplosphaeria fusca]